MTTGLDGDPRLRDIVAAQARVAPFARETPLVRSRWLSEEVGGEVFLKLECFQSTGSFKIRGAANRLSMLAAGTRIVAVSAGNHARAVAECAEALELPATIVMPSTAAPTKISAIRRYAVDLRLEGNDYDEAEAAALELARSSGAVFISPYNDPGVIAGQGTVALEVFDQAGPLDAIVVPTGGGGLLAGVGLVAAPRRCSVVAAQPEVAATMGASFRAGREVRIPQGETLADGLSGNLEPGSITLPIALRTVDHFVLVPEPSIASAVRELIEQEHILVEPSGAVGVAGLIAERSSYRNRRVAVLVTGSNVGPERLRMLLG